jgi:hypothetical protein
MNRLVLSILLFFTAVASALKMPCRSTSLWMNAHPRTTTVATSATVVNVFKTQESLATALCNDFITSATDGIKKKGSFYVAVPGGSVLKMLGGIQNMDHQFN